MDTYIETALKRDSLVDITTLGRKTGEAHKIEIAFHAIDGKVYISGLPGKRDWYANMLSNPAFTFHLKQSMKADLPATAIPILDEAERRRLLSRVTAKWNRQSQLEAFIEDSPLIEVRFAEEQT